VALALTAHPPKPTMVDPTRAFVLPVTIEIVLQVAPAGVQEKVTTGESRIAPAEEMSHHPDEREI